MLLNIVNKTNDITNEQIIRRAMVNNDSNIFISLNNFPDGGSREETGYYEKNNYTDQSNSIPMVSAEFYNKEDEFIDVSHQLPLSKRNINKSISNDSKPVSNMEGTNKILY